MRNQVFISYRQESPDHFRAVRRLGTILRQANLPVMLDQFYLEDHPGGPDESWTKWCEDSANQSACALIVASDGWFSAYDKTAPPGQGLGAAVEADLFRQALYNNQGYNERIRLVFLHNVAVDKIPMRLSGLHRFRPFEAEGAGELIRWLGGRLSVEVTDTAAIGWPEPIAFKPDIADRNMKEWPAIVDLLAGRCSERVLLVEGGSGLGKSELVRQAATYAKKLDVPLAYVDFKGNRNTEEVLGQIDVDLGRYLPAFSGEPTKKAHLLRKDLRALRKPVLLIFDSYEDVANNQNIADWLNIQLLSDLESAPALMVIISGQKVPDHTHASWRDLARHFPLSPIMEIEPWTDWTSRRYPSLTPSVVTTLLKLAGGKPSLMVTYCEVLAKS